MNRPTMPSFFFWLFKQVCHSLGNLSLDPTFLSSFNMGPKDKYSELIFGLSSFDILPMIACKLIKFLYFDIANCSFHRI